MFSGKEKDHRKSFYWGTGILALVSTLWRGLVNFETALSLFNSLNKTEFNIMEYLNLFAPLIIGGIFLGATYLWYRSKDEKTKREDFIDTLTEILEAEKRLTGNAIGNHIKGLKDEFITPLKKALKEDELDKDKLIELLEYDFDHHKTAFEGSNIDDLIERLKLHKTNEVLSDIRYENIKENREK